MAWYNSLNIGAVTLSSQIHPARSSASLISRRSVRHTAIRTEAMGCAAKGNTEGTTSLSALPGPAGGTALVSGSAYRAEISRMIGTLDGEVSRSGSSRRLSKPHSALSSLGKSWCEGRCLAAGRRASAAAPLTSSSLSSSAVTAAGRAAGRSLGASVSLAASTYRNARSAECRTSHSPRRNSTSTARTTASTAGGGSGRSPAPRA